MPSLDCYTGTCVCSAIKITSYPPTCYAWLIFRHVCSMWIYILYKRVHVQKGTSPTRNVWCSIANIQPHGSVIYHAVSTNRWHLQFSPVSETSEPSSTDCTGCVLCVCVVCVCVGAYVGVEEEKNTICSIYILNVCIMHYTCTQTTQHPHYTSFHKWSGKVEWEGRRGVERRREGQRDDEERYTFILIHLCWEAFSAVGLLLYKNNFCHIIIQVLHHQWLVISTHVHMYIIDCLRHANHTISNTTHTVLHYRLGPGNTSTHADDMGHRTPVSHVQITNKMTSLVMSYNIIQYPKTLC